MPVTFEEVRAALEPEEPNYSAARKFGPEALPHLQKLVTEDNPMLAAKAAYLASLIGGEGSHPVVASATASEHPAVRAAAAAAAQNLRSEVTNEFLVKLITDPDLGVRHQALQMVPMDMSPELRTHVERIAEGEANPVLLAASRKALGRAPVGTPAPETAAAPSALGKGGGVIRSVAPPHPGASPGGGKGGGVIRPAILPGVTAGVVATGKGGGTIRSAAPVPQVSPAGRGGGETRAAETPAGTRKKGAGEPRKTRQAFGPRGSRNKPKKTPKKPAPE
jgi:HEAT repeat protein